MIRARITFSKTEAMRYTGHLDLHRTWERTIRRAGLPLAYSQGFHPQPRINLACALPLGFTSECEVLDVWFEQVMEVMDIFHTLESSLPPGILIHNITTIDLHLPSLQSQVIAADYVITFLDPPSDLVDRLNMVINAPHLPRTRRNKPYDLRPLIEELHQVDDLLTGLPLIVLRMSARESATGRPEELLSELGIPFEITRVHRTRLYFAENDR
jgi:radical SAM-linked protein